jgi:uncharacterized ferritin-like protein (DUF455 family)
MLNQSPGSSVSSEPVELRRAALHWLGVPEAAEKSAGVIVLQRSWQEGRLSLNTEAVLAGSELIPGHPARPELVSPTEVPRRSMRTDEGRAAMIHALAHIEFNAINLALDAIWRFPGMPREYYADWLQVAAEEAKHFDLLAGNLRGKGHAYGDFKAHNSLWDMAEKTRGDILARMALVPRTMEARGLDATPPLRAKIAQAGDMDAAAILDIILADEIGHVLTGNRWFNWVCEQRGMGPDATYAALAKTYGAPQLRGPFNMDARRAAGFSESELAALSGK